ncbi:unnamed protein product (macronuclear) [Paramecium tetraurelia]|uniref:RING-type E3 ubiquitin transferase n=1 Tax=Paramecium tetraurelia TaxID=5888 RepID=A0CB72_PARTE|nr:uncharacterized protein GSPATT00036822001 [Paramecium tetraurelia]CAK68039.1 unnamed protein product [Paramecium tetraurelia]|eukprot:XP_001435436.1 hypothetical protein (macronuclear) [Paramecium tetraurelia strain d4-2]
MNIIIYACIIGYAISEVWFQVSCFQTDLDQAYNYLVENQDQLILGQWTASSDYLVYINIIYDNQNLIMQVYPKRHNLLHEKHYFRLSYSLLNSSYYYDTVERYMTWQNIDVVVELQNSQKHPQTICKAMLQVEVSTQTIILHSQFDEQCNVTEERIRLFIFSNSVYEIQVLSYTILIIFISLVQITSAHLYLKSDPAENLGASMTISIILTQDIFICIFSSLLFDMPRLYYFLPCLLCQLTAIYYDLKLKAKLTNMERNKKTLILLQLIEVSSVTFLFLRIRHSFELTLLNTFLIPQILITFYSGERQRFNKYYVGSIFPRALLSIYARGCSQNILQLMQKVHVVYVIVLILLIQLLVYYCQNQFGWFILRRNIHNYFIKQTDEHQQSDCAICLIKLSQTPENTLSKGEPYVLQTINQASRDHLLMNTPCVNYRQLHQNHQFHPSCLSQWMLINLSCPLCKSSLPQVF